jgi:iron complex transport system permease protein
MMPTVRTPSTSISFVLPSKIPSTIASSSLERRATRRWAGATLLALLFASIMLAAGCGAVDVPVSTTFGVFLEFAGASVPWKVDHDVASLLWSIRFPRVLLAAVVGATLATAGGALQGLFRNPLADPGVIGVSAGAMLAAAVAIVLGGRLFPTDVALVWIPWALPMAAFLGAMSAAVIVFTVAGQKGSPSVATMLLAGIAVNAIAAAGTGLLISIANDAQLRALSFWTLGSLGGATWKVVGLAAVPMLVATMGLQRTARALDLQLLGQREAQHLGVNTTQLRRVIVALVALGVGSAVAFVGMIGFVGLIIPHVVRLVLGPSHRGVLPLGALLGASLLVLTDLGARTVMAPMELPIGAITAAIGAPVFLWLVMRRRSTVIA